MTYKTTIDEFMQMLERRKGDDDALDDREIDLNDNAELKPEKEVTISKKKEKEFVGLFLKTY